MIFLYNECPDYTSDTENERLHHCFDRLSTSLGWCYGPVFF